MGRAEERRFAKLESNPMEECHKVQKKYIHELFEMFDETKDQRNQSYIVYPSRVMLGQMVFKGISGIVSMQEMTRRFNTDEAVSNIYGQMDMKALEMLPHHVTTNEYLERLDPNEVRGILHKINYDLIRKKSFDKAKYNREWIVIIDGTQGYSGDRKINDGCLERHYNKGTDQETVNYHCDVLEAKIYFGEGLLASKGSDVCQ